MESGLLQRRELRAAVAAAPIVFALRIGFLELDVGLRSGARCLGTLCWGKFRAAVASASIADAMRIGPIELDLVRAFIMSCGDVMAEFFHIIVLLRNHVTYLIRFSADDYLIITP